jgi:nucleoside-triphosphatase
MIECRLFLTGEPGSGKTTVVERAIEIMTSNHIRIGGMVSREILERGVRVGFLLRDLITQEQGILAHVNQADGPRVGKYRVNLTDIEQVGASSIRRAIDEADVIIVDELGPMELHSMPFILAMKAALESAKPFLGTIHKRASHPLINQIKENRRSEIIEVIKSNREELPSVICARLKSRD